MHIHPPKPLHGWKEFFNEIFVIVVGVLIALGLEQVVEQLHWQHKVHEGLERLRVEATTNARYAAEHIATQPCVEAQLAELEKRVRESGERLEPAPQIENKAGPSVATISFRPYQSGVWAALEADGTQAHIDPALQKLLGITYAGVDDLRAETAQMKTLRGRLLLLSEASPLDAGTRQHLLELLHETANQSALRALQATQVIADYKIAGIEPDEAAIGRFLEQTKAVFASGKCGALGASFADWKGKVDEEVKSLRTSLSQLKSAE